MAVLVVLVVVVVVVVVVAVVVGKQLSCLHTKVNSLLELPRITTRT